MNIHLSYELGKIGETFPRKWNKDYDISHLKSDTQEYHESGFIERYPVDTSKLKMKDIKVFEEEQRESSEYGVSGQAD